MIESDNDNEETPCKTMFVCRNKYCTPDWTACDYLPICPHADGEDYWAPDGTEQD